jgi:hypothetical protein
VLAGAPLNLFVGRRGIEHHEACSATTEAAMTKWIALCGLAAAIGLGSFVLGAHTGSAVHHFGMAQHRAAIDYGYIMELNRNPEGLRTRLEDDLDSELVLYGEYRKSHWSWLFPDLRAGGDKYARLAALYRLQNPHKLQMPIFPPGTNPALVAQVAANYKDREVALQSVLAIFAADAQGAPDSGTAK